MDDDNWFTADDGTTPTSTSPPPGDDEQPVVTQTVLQSIVYVTQTVTATPTPMIQTTGFDDDAADGPQAHKGISQGKLAGIIGGSFVAAFLLTIALVYMGCAIADRASQRAKERRSNYRRPKRQLTIARQRRHTEHSSSGQSTLLTSWRCRSGNSSEPTSEIKAPWPSWSPLPLQRPQSPPETSDRAPSALRTWPRIAQRPASAPGTGAPRLPLTFPFGQHGVGVAGSSPRSGWRHTVIEALTHSGHTDSTAVQSPAADWRNPPPFVSVVNCDTYRRPQPDRSVVGPTPFQASRVPQVPVVSIDSSTRRTRATSAPQGISTCAKSRQGSAGPARPATSSAEAKAPASTCPTESSPLRRSCPLPASVPVSQIGRETPSDIGTVNTMTGHLRHILRVVGNQTGEGVAGEALSSIERGDRRGLRSPASSLPPSSEAGPSSRGHRRSQSETHEPPVWWTKAMQTLIPTSIQEGGTRDDRNTRSSSFQVLGFSHEGGWSQLDPEHRIYPTSLMLRPDMNKSLPALDAAGESRPRRPNARKARSMDGLGSALKEQFDFEPTEELQHSIDVARRESRLITVDDAALASAAPSVPGTPMRCTHPPNIPHEGKSRHPNPIDLAAALAKSVASSLTSRIRERGSAHSRRRSAGMSSHGPSTPQSHAEDFYSPHLSFTELELGAPPSVERDSRSHSRASTPTFWRAPQGRGRYEAVAPSSPPPGPVASESSTPASVAKGEQQTPRPKSHVIRTISMEELAAAPLLL